MFTLRIPLFGEPGSTSCGSFSSVHISLLSYEVTTSGLPSTSLIGVNGFSSSSFLSNWSELPLLDLSDSVASIDFRDSIRLLLPRSPTFCSSFGLVRYTCGICSSFDLTGLDLILSSSLILELPPW